MDAVTLPPEVTGQASLPFRLKGSQAKTAYALRMNCEQMFAEGGLESIGFLTLTVGDTVAEAELDGSKRDRFQQVFEADEANRRINNLNRRVLSDLFERAIIVTERHKNGAVHFHCLGILRGRPDIRTGFDFDRVAKRDYKNVPDVLRGLWQHLRGVLPRYGFGRAELTPVRETAGAMSSYISKYIEKNICNRIKADARKKLVRYVGWDKRQLKAADFSWGTPRSTAWRTRARNLAALVGITEKEQMADAYGPRWGFYVTDIMNRIAPWSTGMAPAIAWEGYRSRDIVRMELVRLSKGYAQKIDRLRRPVLSEKRMELITAPVMDFREGGQWN